MFCYTMQTSQVWTLSINSLVSTTERWWYGRDWGWGLKNRTMGGGLISRLISDEGTWVFAQAKRPPTLRKVPVSHKVLCSQCCWQQDTETPQQHSLARDRSDKYVWKHVCHGECLQAQPYFFKKITERYQRKSLMSLTIPNADKMKRA